MQLRAHAGGRGEGRHRKILVTGVDGPFACAPRGCLPVLLCALTASHIIQISCFSTAPCHRSMLTHNPTPPPLIHTPPGGYPRVPQQGVQVQGHVCGLLRRQRTAWKGLERGVAAAMAVAAAAKPKEREAFRLNRRSEGRGGNKESYVLSPTSSVWKRRKEGDGSLLV